MEERSKELIIHAEKTAEALVNELKKRKFSIALAESCTAGIVSNLIANISDASKIFWGSYVCYTQEAKVSMLGIDNDKLLIHGLVSRETARVMAENALIKSGAGISLAVTGLAGPLGDGSETEIGTVWIAVSLRDKTASEREFHFEGSRNEIRLKAAIAALEEIMRLL
jgi:PncC family amidohydrolase